ncbi:hypothetical protein EV401DRAFT_2068720 [Pisolithus croceorrhizus]|nr:hypothetical protein EV401DRAFT_2068720 [Pisolithus croceorrhizus]
MAGEAEFCWKNLYGSVVRVKGILGIGEDQLVVSDLKALSQILSSALQHFPKAEGDVHKQQRKILNPGFGAAGSWAFLAISQACAQSMASKQMEFVDAGESDKVVLNIPS